MDEEEVYKLLLAQQGMNEYLNYTTLIGFIGQGLFFARFAVQLFLSEKQKKVIAPPVFWKISLFASLIFFIYGYLRKDFSIMLGQSLTYFIYIRNLQLQGKWKNIPKPFQFFLFTFPFFIVAYAYHNGIYDLYLLLNNENIASWLLTLGIISQLVFVFRFVYQWITSEKKKTSHLPIGFWYISLLGSILIFIYAIYRIDLVLILAHSIGMFVYLRNIFILKKEMNENN